MIIVSHAIQDSWQLTPVLSMGQREKPLIYPLHWN